MRLINTEPGLLNLKKVLSIQWLRAFAIGMVILQHVAWKGTQYSTNPLGWLKVGEAGVDLFFIVSGFVMCHVTYNRTQTPPAFMKARLVRILPLYWLLTCAALAVFWVKPELVNSSGGVTSIFHSFTLLPTSSKYLIQNGWTLSYEFYFYAIFSVGLLFPKTATGLWAAIFLLLSGFIGVLSPVGGVYTEFFSNSVLIEFAMGIALFHIARKFTPAKGLTIALVVCATLLLGYVNFARSSGERALDYGVPCFLFAFAILGLEASFTRFEQSYAGAAPVKMGDASYSLYLVHPFALSLVSIILAKLGLAGHAFIFSSVLVVSALISGFICYAWVELPLQKRARQLFLRPT